eukprot:1757619-Amphidinium_carterae.1
MAFCSSRSSARSSANIVRALTTNPRMRQSPSKLNKMGKNFMIRTSTYHPVVFGLIGVVVIKAVMSRVGLL